MNFLMVSPDKYWFPSASGKYQEAIQDLRAYSEDLRLGRSHFIPGWTTSSPCSAITGTSWAPATITW